MLMNGNHNTDRNEHIDACVCQQSGRSVDTNWRIITVVAFILLALASFAFAASLHQTDLNDTSAMVKRIGDLERRVEKLEQASTNTGRSSDNQADSSDNQQQTAKDKLTSALNEAKRRLSNAGNNVKQTEGYRDLQAGVDVVANKLSQADASLSDNSQTYVKLKDMLDALVSGLTE